MISNCRNKLHQTTYKEIFSALRVRSELNSTLFSENMRFNILVESLARKRFIRTRPGHFRKYLNYSWDSPIPGTENDIAKLDDELK